MIEFRRKRGRSNPYLYAKRPVIRVAKNTQSVFIISKLIIYKLKMNPETDGLMFGLKAGKLTVKVEKKEEDNYHLSKGDTSTYRFRSNELHKFVTDHFKVNKDVHFMIEMQEDLTFKKI